MNDRLIAVPGSARRPLPGARAVGPSDASEHVSVTVYVRPGSRAPTPDSLLRQARRLPGRRRYLDGDELARRFGAAPADLAAVERFAAGHGLTVVEERPAARSLRLAGAAGDVAAAFGVTLERWEHAGGAYRGRTGDVGVPASLAGVVEAVLGLDNRPVGRSYVRAAPLAWSLPDVRAGGRIDLPPNTYLPPQLASLYGFPPGTDGAGQTVAVLVFNGAVGATGIRATGGYDAELLRAYFTRTVGGAMPELVDVVVHGPGNQPGDGSGEDVSREVYLDLCVVGSVAPRARIAAYFTEFTEQGWVDAISRAATDTANDPSVISISYGNPEDDAGRSLWTAMAVRQVDQAFQAAAAAGRTICCASGDDGAHDEPGDGRAHVDFPASSPWVLGCGGTRVEARDGAITSEVVWNDLARGHGATGGGVSRLFAVPPWQLGAGVPPVAGGRKKGRGVPDVASLADPETPLVVVAPDRRLAGVGGTSAAAPMWAALIARVNQALGARAGFLNPILYGRAAGALRDITAGDNGAYRAGVGWDPCTGHGAPGAAQLVAALSSAPAPRATRRAAANAPST